VTTRTDNMICPNCGSEMNHHADKLVLADASGLKLESSDEVIFQFHACPACGVSAVRPA
jgi:ribosomal protein S27AE